MKQVLLKLKQAGVYLKPKKYKFHVQEVKYLGLIVTTDGIQIDRAKVAAIKEYETPTNFQYVQVLLGFGKFYRRFILRYSKNVILHTSFTKQDQYFH